MHSGGGNVGGMSGQVVAECHGEPRHAIIGAKAGARGHSFHLTAETMSEPPTGKSSDAFPGGLHVVGPALASCGTKAIETSLGHLGQTGSAAKLGATGIVAKANSQRL